MTARRRQSLRRRLDNVVLRWQARLDGEWADRVVPWAAAGTLFVLLFALALARARSLEGGAGLANYVQAAWLISEGHRPELTITGTTLLADHAAFAFYPIAALTRVLPTIPILLGVQSAALALGVVPVWRIARRLADLRVGAASALVVAYALHPAVQNLNVADFHPEALALPALLGAFWFGLTERWWLFAACATLAVLTRADLGLAVAGIGVVLALDGRRRVGLLTGALGVGWSLLAVLAIQPGAGDGSFVHADVFGDYGDTVGEVIVSMVTSPLTVLGDLVAEANLEVVVALLAPLLFLPVLAPRYLLPVLPLEALYLVAEVEAGPADGPQRTVAATAFVLVAATFALERLGRRSTDRVLVDRRILVALALAALVLFARDAATSPYREPWDWGGRDEADAARLAAVDLVADDAPVQASPMLLPLLAERPEVYPLDPGERLASSDRSLTIVADQASGSRWSPAERRRFQARVEAAGLDEVYNREGITVFTR